MNKKPARLSSLWNVILNAAAAIVWTVHSVVLIVYTRDNEPPEIILFLDIICAMIWWIAFAAALIRYRGDRQNK